MSGPKVIKFPKIKESGTVEIQPHPEDVIDVDPQILAVMKARLAGDSLDQVFSRDDQITNELAIEHERQKVKAVFKNESEVFGGFASLDAVKVTRAKLREHQVDRDLLSQYAIRKSAGQAIDEADLYAHLVTGCDLRPKQKRIELLNKLTPTLSLKAREVASSLAQYYLADPFGAFGVSEEIIELHPGLREQLRNGEIQSSMNEVLNVLYRGAE